MNKTPILLNKSNLKTRFTAQVKSLMSCSYTWHKIYVENATGYSRNYVLESFTSVLPELDFIPVHYQKEGNNISFLLKNCEFALKRLCSRKLTVPHERSSKPFDVAILLGFDTDVQVNVQQSIRVALTKRYDATTNTMDLSEFHNDPDLTDYCSLAQPKLLYYVLHLSAKYRINTLRLNKNGLYKLKSLEALVLVDNLTSIDLSDNNLKSFAELDIIKKWPVRKIVLEGNPLCNNLTGQAYILHVRELWPMVDQLDGVSVPVRSNVPFHTNYLCDPNAFDLVEKFLAHFFTLYDSRQRIVLEELYDPSASFSLNAHYFNQHLSFAAAQLRDYIQFSRNVKGIADYSTVYDKSIIGSKNIIQLLSKLPSTKHDISTFHVDLMYSTAKCTIIVVNGVFREASSNLLEPDRMVAFCRTFVLAAIPSSNEHQIVNEQLSIYNPSNSQLNNNEAPPEGQQKTSDLSVTQLVRASNTDEIECFVDALKRLTNLNEKFARKCLESSYYDFVGALELFHKLFKEDKLPLSAFLTEKMVEELITTECPSWKALTATTSTPVTALPNSAPKPQSPSLIPIADIQMKHNPFDNSFVGDDTRLRPRRTKSRSPSPARRKFSRNSHKLRQSKSRSTSVEFVGEKRDADTNTKTRTLTYLEDYGLGAQKSAPNTSSPRSNQNSRTLITIPIAKQKNGKVKSQISRDKGCAAKSMASSDLDNRVSEPNSNKTSNQQLSPTIVKVASDSKSGSSSNALQTKIDSLNAKAGSSSTRNESTTATFTSIYTRPKITRPQN